MKLYNSLTKPDVWPLRFEFDGIRMPMPINYIQQATEVLSMDVGCEVLVDDFILEKSTLERAFHRPRKSDRNHILRE